MLPHMLLSLILGFLLGAAALLFALQNTAVVALSFLGWSFATSLALLILIAFTIGIIVSVLISLPHALRDRFRLMSLTKENRRLTDEVAALTRARGHASDESAIPPVLDIRDS